MKKFISFSSGLLLLSTAVAYAAPVTFQCSGRGTSFSTTIDLSDTDRQAPGSLVIPERSGSLRVSCSPIVTSGPSDGSIVYCSDQFADYTLTVARNARGTNAYVSAGDSNQLLHTLSCR